MPSGQTFINGSLTSFSPNLKCSKSCSVPERYVTVPSELKTLLSCEVRPLLEQLIQRCFLLRVLCQTFLSSVNWEKPHLSASFQVFGFTSFAIPSTKQRGNRGSAQLLATLMYTLVFIYSSAMHREQCRNMLMQIKTEQSS